MLALVAGALVPWTFRWELASAAGGFVVWALLLVPIRRWADREVQRVKDMHPISSEQSSVGTQRDE